MVAALISAGADVNAHENAGQCQDDERPHDLGDAVPPGLRLLQRHDCDGDRPGDFGDTPLHLVVKSERDAGENLTVIALLIEAGARVNARNLNYPRPMPLDEAALYGKDPSVISTLASLGADVNAKDDHKARPLHYAATFNENPDMIVALVEAGPT